MKLQILKTVSLGEKVLFKGQDHEVPADIAAKWVAAGYAKELAQPKPSKPSKAKEIA